MNKTKAVHHVLTFLNFLVIAVFIWSLINYKVLDATINKWAVAGGLVFLIIFIIFLEGAPIVAGPTIAVAAFLTIGEYTPLFIYLVFILSGVVGNFIWFYLGVFSGHKLLKYFDPKVISRYEKLFKKYGWWTMVITAVTPIPYLPTLAGIFDMKWKHMFIGVMGVRIIRHTIVFIFWMIVVGIL